MHSSLGVLGLSRELVERERSTGSLEGILAIAEGYYRVLAKRYHPDRNSDPEAQEYYSEIVEAIEDLRDPLGLELAVQRYVSDGDQAALQVRRAVSDRRKLDERTLGVLLNLTQNVDQFHVMGVTKPSSFLMSFGVGSRVILEVLTPSISRIALDHINGAREAINPRFVSGQWVETVLSGTDRSGEPRRTQVTHSMATATAVTVIGFLPRSARNGRSDLDFIAPTGSLQLDRPEVAASGIAWTDPANAWYLSHLVAINPGEGAEVIAMNATGKIAPIGEIITQRELKRTTRKE